MKSIAGKAELYPVIKANAYGLGDLKIFNILYNYGCKHFFVATIEEALNFDGPVICDVNCHEHHTYQPRIIGWATPIEDMYPYLPRDEFRANMYIDPIGDWENPPMPDVIDGME